MGLTVCISNELLGDKDGAGPEGTPSGLGLGSTCTNCWLNRCCVLPILPPPRMSFCHISACQKYRYIKVHSHDKSSADPHQPPDPHQQPESTGPSDGLPWPSASFHAVLASFSLTGASLLTGCASTHFCYFESMLRETLSPFHLFRFLNTKWGFVCRKEHYPTLPLL